ncbi:hypothetical protein BJ875DRAFT_514462 [Amylocarpus encephaloides]|uniref:Uncharacterized protein n=1 Tax=Amylocarpus encephaloides TaxID=45428 RepID=A0A9P7YFC4_9HELO|nr:hypothetical protein BJ875DRAFT_514462 [Amylocarpus encephaloides]
MATTTATRIALQPVEIKVVEPQDLEEGLGKIGQGVPDPRSLKNSSDFSLRDGEFPAAEVAVESPPPTTTNAPQACAEASQGQTSNTLNATRDPLDSSSSGPNAEILNGVGNSYAAEVQESSTTDGITYPQVATKNCDSIQERHSVSSILDRQDGTALSPRSDTTVGLVISDASIVQTQPAIEPEGRPVQSLTPSPELQPKVPTPSPTFKFIGPTGQVGKRSIWRKVQNFTQFTGENLYLATSMIPEVGYVKQWQEKWEPMLRAEIWDLSIDQNDIFTIDLRMAGENPDTTSMKPTILVICNETQKNVIENRLSGIVRQTLPKDVRFQVIGRRVSTAAPSMKQRKDFGQLDLIATFQQRRVGFQNTNHPLETMMGSVAGIYINEEVSRQVTIPLSTLGGIIAVGDSLYALTTSHSLSRIFQPEGYIMVSNDPFIPCGKIERWKWTGEVSEQSQAHGKSSRHKDEPAMDWTLISIFDGAAFPNHFVIDKANGIGGEVIGFARNKELQDVEDVWICSSSGTQSGILCGAPVIFVLGGATFKVHTVILERPSVDGDSGSWIVSQTTHKLCGYIFAKVDGIELSYMLPIEPVLDDISKELSGMNKLDVDIPDGATIRRLVGRNDRLIRLEAALELP